MQGVAMVCSNCGSQQAADVTVCLNCQQLMPSADQTDPAPTTRSRRWSGGWLILAGLLALIGMAIIKLSLPMTSIPGPGMVQFGQGVASSADRVTAPRRVFRAEDPFAYVAHLNRPVNAPTLDIIVAASDGNNKNVLVRTTIRIPDPTVDHITNATDMATLMRGHPPGQYTLQFAQAGTILAEGGFLYTR
jgi:hypothetical protein